MGRVSPSHFLQNVLIETSNVCFKNFYISHLVLCHFLMPWSLENSKGINTFSITFSNNEWEDYVFWSLFIGFTAQKMKFSIIDFFSTCDQIRRKLRIWSHFLMKLWIKNFVSLCSAYIAYEDRHSLWNLLFFEGIYFWRPPNFECLTLEIYSICNLAANY